MKNPVVSSRIPEKLIRQVDHYAKRNKLTRSTAIAALLVRALRKQG